MSFTLFLRSLGGNKQINNQSGLVHYYFDWDIVKPNYNQEYEVSFMMISTVVGTNFNRTMTTFLNVGSFNKGYELTVSNGANVSYSLGNVSSIRQPNENVYINFATYANQNPPIRFVGQPSKNLFSIEFRDFRRYITSPFLTNADYVIGIYFRAILNIPKTIILNRSFSLILNSENGILKGDAPNFTSIVEFNVDWHLLSNWDQRFRLNSVFSTKSVINELSGNNINKIMSNWGASHNCFESINIDGSTQTINSSTIALFKPMLFKLTGGQYSYKRNNNLPIILNNLPTKNNFTLSIEDYNGGPSLNGFECHWTISLFFEAI